MSDESEPRIHNTLPDAESDKRVAALRARWRAYETKPPAMTEPLRSMRSAP